MKQFAKLFDYSDIGQVLVKLDTNDQAEAEVRFYFKPENLGICSVALSGFPGTDDDQWQQAETGFNNIDAAAAHELVTATLKTLPGGLGA
ncbi:hypothetical protein [Ectopseudomonas hydrolytica]|uniref:hypothetical protein n=1 Tax=Ectopseudomonas hydrolytica TaxID=2493633 RepID=UPI00376EE6F1